jgi:exosortase
VTSSASSRFWIFPASLLFLALTLGWLYGFLPYFEGYNTEKASLWQVLWSAWHGYQGEWTHGMLVPYIVGFLVWYDWKLIKPVEMRPSRWGLALIVFAFFSYWFGYIADNEYFGWAAFPVLLAGLILWSWGWKMMLALLFPWAFLVFMFPMPFLDNMLASPLRLHMASYSHLVLELFGVANDTRGTAIVSAADPLTGRLQGARFAIDIADPCSGLHSLFALLMTGALYAHMSLDKAWQKWVLFLAAIPLAVLGNITRIVLITFATIWWGNGVALGTEENPSTFHMGAGFAVFFVALGGMVLLGMALTRLGGLLHAPANPSPPAPAPENQKDRLVSLLTVRSLTVTGLAVATAFLCLWATPPSGLTVAGVIMDLPQNMGRWRGFDTPISEAEKTILPTDTEFARKDYKSPEGDDIMCSIVLSGVERRSIHRPEICLPSQGYTIESGQVVDVPLLSGHTLKVMNLSLTQQLSTSTGGKVTVPSYYMYWFVGHNVTTPYHMERLWLTSWDRVVHHVNHRWAYIIVTSYITQGLTANGKSPSDTLAMMKGFIADILPYFQKDNL